MASSLAPGAEVDVRAKAFLGRANTGLLILIRLLKGFAGCWCATVQTPLRLLTDLWPTTSPGVPVCNARQLRVSTRKTSSRSRAKQVPHLTAEHRHSSNGLALE